MRIPIAIGACVVVALLALPAGAAPPSKQQIAQLKRQVAALKRQVAALKTNMAVLNAKVAELEQQRKDADAWAIRMGRFQRALGRRLADVDPCVVTRPNGSQPPGSTFGVEFHGNGRLWVGVPYSNIVVDDDADADGALEMKYGWWREVSGTLTISGRRLDGPAPPLSADIPDGYDSTGFQASGVSFSTKGCWEVTGRVGDATLTFVTLVVAA